MVIEKTCVKCGFTGDGSDLKLFVKDSRQMAGKYKQTMNCCRKCWNERDAEYRRIAKEKNAEAYKTRLAANVDKFRAAHPDARKAEHAKRVEKYGKGELNRRQRALPNARSDQSRFYGNSKNRRLKVQIIDAYGGKCYCCGIDHPSFLTIDHINDDGAEQRRQGKQRRGCAGYRDIIKAGFPEDLRLSCWNCNSGRHFNGGICPHEEARQIEQQQAA